jgi:hypothetical protein
MAQAVDDALRRAADAEQHVDSGVGARRHDRTGHVASTMNLIRAGRADLVGKLLVADSVEHRR